MIKVENVTKKYGSFVAVNNISFEIKEGEIVGFLGKNGAGKSTTMNMITGYIEPTEGKIEINGYNMSLKPKKAKKEIGYMPEGVPLYQDLTVKEFISFMAELKGVKSKERKEEVQRVMKETGLTEVQNTLNKHLSRGYKQRVSLAGALVGNPKVLILDEPTVGLDPQQVKQIRELIKSLGKNHTVLLSSHILSEVSQICEKVIVIDKGNLVAIDTPDNLEKTVNNKNILNVTVEDKNNKIEEVVKQISNITDIKLINENSDGTKQYAVFAKEKADIRKEVFEKFAKNEITIFELKKSEATLEEAFLQLINNYRPEKEEIKMEEKDVKKAKKEEKEAKKLEKKKKKEEAKKEQNKEKETEVTQEKDKKEQTINENKKGGKN